MTSRRKFLTLLGGGTIAAATGFGYAATRRPQTALAPWQTAADLAAGQGALDPRHRALSFALLAPNPHNRQPWIVDLSTPDTVTLYPDTTRLLPHTDPLHRQITLGLGGFLALMTMAAAEDGHRVDLTLFPEGVNETALDARPIATARFVADPSVPRDPLFAQVLNRRSNKEPYDTTRPIPAEGLARILAAAPGTAGSIAPDSIETLRALSHEALKIEIETPHTFQESVDLFRIGRREVDQSPDGIDFTGPLFESLHLLGLFDRGAAADPTSSAYKAGLDAVYANADTAMGHIWLVTPQNRRADQIAAGAAWLRMNLAATAEGIATQPLSQALQEYPEMAPLYKDIHARLAPSGGTVQMFARIGYGATVAPSPRWPLEAKLRKG